MDQRMPDTGQDQTATEHPPTARTTTATLDVNERSISGRVPTPPTSLIGREGEVAAIRDLLHPPAGNRLIVLTGPGGVGKTRLALSVAAEAANVFADGVAYIPLAAIRDPALVVAVLAKAVGVRETGGRPLVEQIVARVADQQRLFVLDNFEHVLEAGPLLGELLASCPRLTVLVTSRSRLHLSGENDFPVSPLALPHEDDSRQPVASASRWLQVEEEVTSALEDAAGSAAVQLFVARARAVNSGFALTEENALAVVGVCRRLDGLPLAIELAAARAAILSPVALLARLDRGLPLLTNGPRDAPVRQRTLRDAIAWSYDLLDPAEQKLFRHLAVFAGGFSIEAAARVSDVESGDVFTLISSIVDKSLVQPAEGLGGEPRFAMLETIREFGLEQLQARREWERAGQLHAEYFLTFAETAELQLRGRDQRAQLALLETEHDNLRAALSWSLAAPDRADLALRLASALHWFWYLRDHYGEGRRWLEEVLARPATAQRTPARVKALAGAGLLAIRRFRDYTAARAWLEQSIWLGRAIGDTAGVAYALHVLVWMDLFRADQGKSRSAIEESVALFREAGDQWGLATSLCTLGMAIIVTQEPDAASPVLAESLSLARELGDTWGLARALHYSGEVARYLGDDERARGLYEESRTLYRELDHRGSAAIVLHNLGHVAQHQGNPQRALECFAEALAEHVTYGDRQNIGYCLRGIAGTVAQLGHPEQAARLFGATESLFATIGSSIWPIDRIDYDSNLAGVRTRLGEATFAAAFAAGRSLPLEQAIAEATAVTDAIRIETKRSQVAPGSAIPDAALARGLTARESEVLHLLARRATDREIADELSISPRTVMHHVSRVLTKLGVANRRDAAALVTTRDIAD